MQTNPNIADGGYDSFTLSFSNIGLMDVQMKA